MSRGTHLVQVPSWNGKIRVFEVPVDDSDDIVNAIRNGATLEDMVRSGSWVYSVDYTVVD